MSYDEGSNVVRVPLAMMGDDVRRKKLVLFTCKPCGARTARLVNPLAWEKGLVFGQCQNCGAWHALATNNPKLYEEIRYADDDDGGVGDGGVGASSSSSRVSDQTAAAAGTGGEDDNDDGASKSIN